MKKIGYLFVREIGLLISDIGRYVYDLGDWLWGRGSDLEYWAYEKMMNLKGKE